MIVDELRTRDLGERVERSARLRWIGGSFRLRIEVPAGCEAPEGDATGFMFVALALAMYRGEDLQLDAAVSQRALEQTERIQAIFAAWDPDAARRCRVRAAELAPPQPAPAGHGCLISRGADSLYSATAPDAGTLTHLVYCDSLEPIQDERVRAEDRRLVTEVAELVGLPLVRISTNLRDPRAQLIDYYDLHGPGIAFMAHALGGALRRIRVPATWTHSVLVPGSSHPLVDPLFSSETLDFEHHGFDLGRPAKVAHVAQRPALLAYMKTCNAVNSEGNCGRCFKCLWTMACLQAVGALGAARLFPAQIDVDAMRAIRFEGYQHRLAFLQVAACLGDAPEDRRVRAAIHHAVHRSARPSPAERVRFARAWLRGERAWIDPSWSATPAHHYANHTNSLVATMVKGVPFRFGIEFAAPQPQPAWSVGPLRPGWAPPPHDAPELVGLLRLLDPRGRRHRYAAGRLPPIVGAVRVGELGALRRERPAGGVAVWVDAGGGVRIEDAPAPNGLPRAGPIARWVLAPARWRGFATPHARAAELGRRVLDSAVALRHAPTSEHEPAAQEPAGYLHAEDGDGRLALYVARHPVTGDQLLSTDPHESGDLGYGSAAIVGYLESAAPATGSLELARPLVPWASRFGQRRTTA